MSGNVFRRNGVGFRSRISAIAVLTFSNNDFVENGLVIDNQGSTGLAANGNYWGEPTTTELIQGKANLSRINDKQDNSSVGQVVISQYATDSVVVLAPIITQQPASQTVNQGGTATFSLAATSTASLNYQWRFNGLNLTNGGRFSGATSDLLTIANVDPSNAGNYTVVVTNAGGAVTSSVATLTVTTAPPVYHTVDFRDPRWVIDGTEANRVLSYWRAGAYHLEPAGLDGYAGGPGNTNGIKQSADYRTNFWTIDGTEANRVWSYWRAGGYHVDVSGVDGCPWKNRWNNECTGLSSCRCVQFIHPSAATYSQGRSLTVQTHLAYAVQPLFLLWNPRLPVGWRLLSVAGDGSPETNSREILWTGAIPPQQIQMIYTVEVPAGDYGLKEIQGDVECHFAGQANPITLAAAPSLVLGEEGSGFNQITAVERLPNGLVQLNLRAELGQRYEIQVSRDLVQWDTLTTVVNDSGTIQISDPEAVTQQRRFYRARLVPSTKL